MIKKYNHLLVGVAHITGGGIHGNLCRIIPNNLHYKLKRWRFPDVFKWIQQETNMSNLEMLNTFNCGYGMILITNKKLDDFDYIGDIL